MKQRWLGTAVLCLWAFAVWAAPAPAASEGYNLIQRAFLKEDFSQAVALAQAFLLENPAGPEMPRVWLWLALSLDKLQQSNEALRELNRLKDRLPAADPLWPEVLYWEGDISRRAMSVVRAKVTFQRLLDRYPDSSWSQQAQLGIGLIDLHQQDFDSALFNFKQVALHEPNSPVGRDARLFQGVCHMQLKQFREAEAVFKPLLDEIKEPVNSAQTAFYLGEVLSGQDRYEEALSAYQRAIEVKSAPQWAAPAQFGLGWSYYRLGQCKPSIKAFDQFLRSGIAYHQTEATFAEGSCLLKLGQEEEAISFFERVLTRDREHPLAVESGLAIVDTYRKQGKTALAFDLLEQLMERPLNAASKAQVQLRLASLELEGGRAEEAQSLYDKVKLSSDPVIQQAANSGLGDVRFFLGDLSGARQYYNEVIRKLPGASLARYATYQLGRISMQRGDLKDAASVFEQLSAIEEPDIAEDARLALALTYLNQGQEPLALSTLNEMRKGQANAASAARAAYYLAIVSASQGNTAQAKQLCQETITKAPRTDEAADALLLSADLIAQQSSQREATRWLKQQLTANRLLSRQRGKVAKRLGDLARDSRNYAEAILWYDEAAKLLPALGGEMVYRIATSYEEGGDIELALRWYRQVNQAPWSVRGMLALAKLLEHEERLKEALEIYEQLSKLDVPESKLAQERLEATRDAIRRASVKQ